MRWLRTTPTALAALVWGVCAAMLIGNMAIAPIAYDYQFHLWSIPVFGDLAGVVPPGKRRATARTLLDGSFQASYGTQLGARLPVFPGAVRLRNQIDYSVFGVSATPDVIVGADGELIERAYVDDYCSRDLSRFLPGARIWAHRIREMQDAVERQGKTFLYVLTPSKVAQYPEFLPPGWPCPSSQADRAGLVPAWTGLLQAAGVHVVDTIGVVSSLHGRFPFPLFPSGGTHWNGLASTQAGQAVAAGLDGLRPGAGFARLPFTWTMNDAPEGVDVDLALLMNLLWMRAEQPVPEVEFGPGARPTACADVRIVMVGGSFGHAVNDYLSREPCHPVVVEYEYWHTIRLDWNDGALTLGAVDEGQRARDLSAAGVVLYEENEQTLGQPEQGRALYQFITGHPA